MIKYILIFLLICTPVYAASVDDKLPTSGDEYSYSTWNDEDWSPNPNPSTAPNITANDGTAATSLAPTWDTGNYTVGLRGQTFDFSGIPAGATIDGVTVELNAWHDNGGVDWNLCMLLDVDGDPVGTNLCSDTPQDISATADGTNYTEGGAAETWGNSLTDTWVKDADFGILVGFIATGNNADVYVDTILMTITYTESAGRTRRISITNQETTMQVQINRIEEKLNEILKILNGNGKTGLCAKVNIMWGCSVFVIAAIIKVFFFQGAIVPKITWEEIDEILHGLKGDLTTLSGIEVKCRKMRQHMANEIEKIQDIILKVADEDN